ncbi:MAG: family transcriptional regulator [Frankiales bacterium]|nr:family transcriptional regulator [Frankiales bacterium]
MAQRTAVRPEEIRRHNVSLVLRHIHQHGEVTRAELTAATGLNRSTIGALVADLVGLGMVEEYVPPGRDRAGRPSHVVAPRPDGPYVIAVDIAVERVVTAAVGLGGRVYSRRATVIEGAARSPAGVTEQIVADAIWLASQLPPRARPVGIGISIPGIVRRRDGFVEHAPNLNWRAVPFADLLRHRIAEVLGSDLDVWAGNDADLGAVAEHQRGAAFGLDNVIYINGSVGVGGGIIADGAQLHGFGGYAGEIGHMTLDPAGPKCHCGSTGCIETYIGEHALLRAAGVEDEHGPAVVARVFAEADAGDEQALAAVHEVAVWLGRGLANLVNVFNPQVVIIGGSLAGVLRLGQSSIEAELDRRAMSAARSGVRILPPGLADDSGLIGAAELAFQSLLAAPDSPVPAVAN